MVLTGVLGSPLDTPREVVAWGSVLAHGGPHDELPPLTGGPAADRLGAGAAAAARCRAWSVASTSTACTGCGRAGDSWSRWRPLFFVGLGLGPFLVATTSFLAVYDTTLLWVHMVQHMVLGMVMPIFLALGAPITLALRTLPRGGRRAAAGRAAQPGREGPDASRCSPACSSWPTRSPST